MGCGVWGEERSEGVCVMGGVWGVECGEFGGLGAIGCHSDCDFAS